jgi:thioredoxin reductase (NADPH)
MSRAPPGTGDDEGQGAFFFDVAVVGLGPAGISTATELVRYGRHVVALEAERVGGLVHEARRVENLPVMVVPGPGHGVVEALRAHLKRLPPRVINVPVREVRLIKGGFEVWTAGAPIRCRAVVLATGTRPRRLEVPGEDLPWVAHRWTDLKGRPPERVAVVGGGDLAVDQALSLADAGFEVELLVRSERLRCNKRLRDELKDKPAVRVRLGHEVVRFTEGPAVECVGPSGPATISVGCALVSVGREPELPPVTDAKGQRLEPSTILAGEVPGLFPVGDLVAGRRRQVAIAMGSGLDAAMRCEEYLSGADR